MILTKAKPRPQKNTKAVVSTKTMPAPTRGINAKDSLATMRPGDALTLDNMICRPGYVEVRKGHQTTATGISSPTETVFGYVAASGAVELFAAGGGNIWNVTASGAVGAAVVTGLASAYGTSTQVSNAAGNFLFYATNAADTLRLYNGTAWAVSTITVMPLTSVGSMLVFKRRVWFTQRGTTRAWYLPIDAITGAAVAFDFASIFKRGGSLQTLINMSIDTGQGPDDFLLAVSTQGEVAMYKGTDPASAATFALVGVYYIGAPVGERFWTNYGGDVIMLTREGLVPFSKFIQSTAVNKSSFVSDRIQQRFADDIANYGSTQGWEVHLYFADNFLFVQVPAGDSDNGTRYCWVMNTITGAWSRFLWDFNTYCVVDTLLRSADNTQVYDAWNGGLDIAEPIEYTCIPAFDYFGSPTNYKQFTLGRVTIQSDQAPSYQTDLLIDFNADFNFPSAPAAPASGSLWNVGLWGVALWGGSLGLYRDWYSLPGAGHAASQVLQGQSAGATLRLISFDYAYMPGALL